jgi:hypothetical protein
MEHERTHHQHGQQSKSLSTTTTPRPGVADIRPLFRVAGLEGREGIRRTGTVAVSAFTVLLVLGLFTHEGRAEDNVDAAREHYQRGKRAYDVGHFAEAAKEYELAYAAKDDPALLFNLGQAQRMAGDRTAAVLAYKAYLRNAPDAPNRAEVEQRIQELQTTPSVPLTESPPLPGKVNSPPPTRPADGSHPALPSTAILTSAPPPHSRPLHKKWWLWTITAVVAGAAATALAVGVPQGQPREPVLQVHSP